MEEWIATTEGYVNRFEVKSFSVEGNQIYLNLKDGRRILKSKHTNSDTLNKEVEVLEMMGLTEEFQL